MNFDVLKILFEHLENVFSQWLSDIKDVISMLCDQL